MSVNSAGRRRVYLHIGTPKSGTSFIQASLRANQSSLRGQGVLYPASNQAEMFRAGLEMRGNYAKWGRTHEEVAGRWAELARRARSFDGTTVISNEILAAAGEDSVRRMLADLEGLDVHIVLTVRNLARQFPAAWQQGIKHGGRHTYTQFRRLVTDEKRRRQGRMFWGLQDVSRILVRWAADVPPSNVHVITVPPSGTDPDVLWHRFCQVIGVDPARNPSSSDRSNVSLGITEIDLLRRINEIVHERDDATRRLSRLVNRSFVPLLRRHSSPRAGTPEDLIPWLRTISETWISEIKQQGYDVVGDLDELIPDGSESSDVDPDAVPAEATLDVAVATIVDLLEEVQRLQDARATRYPRLSRRMRRRLSVLKRRVGGLVRR